MSVGNNCCLYHKDTKLKANHNTFHTLQGYVELLLISQRY